MRPLALIAGVNRALAVVCGYALLALTFLIVFEIFARRLLGFSLQGVDEIGGYVVAITGTFGFAYALLERSHTRIDIVLNRFAGRGRSLLNALAMLMVAAAALFMTWYAYRALGDSIEFNSRAATPLQTPIWIPQSLWLAGLVLFSVTGVALAVHAVLLAARDPREANRRYGPSSLEEEIERELTDASARAGRVAGSGKQR